jgi:hypothetical protein
MPAIHRKRLRFIDSLFAMLQTGVTPSERDVGDARKEIRLALKSGAEVRRMHRERQEKKQEAHQQSSAQIRASVMARAVGCCEVPSCGAPFSAVDPAEWDHLLGGSGQRRERQSLETTWAIHASCHRDRTENRPSSTWWWKQVKKHAERFGYSAMVAEAERRLP